jgi:hypothetical protein
MIIENNRKINSNPGEKTIIKVTTKTTMIIKVTTTIIIMKL